MKVEALIINPGNPRKITDAKLAQLKKSMLELGDISGVVFNVNTGNVVGGAQRCTDKNGHPTVKPFKLMRYLIRLVTPPGGIVLDPFLGSGTTGAVAVACGFRFVGYEKEKEYFITARDRIRDVKCRSI